MTDAQLERLADLIADRLADKLKSATTHSGLVDAATLARLLGVSRNYVYENADKLGAVKIGDGDKPRLRFDPERAIPTPAPALAEPLRAEPRPRGARTPSDVPLLPIRREEA